MIRFTEGSSILLLLFWTVALGKPELQYPFGDCRNCPLSNDQNFFEVLPGGGWDNLRNIAMGQVVFMNYSQCKMTEDRLYLIPDGFFVTPLKHSQVQRFSEMFEHWSDYTSMTAKSINLNAWGGYDGFSISASFSYEHQSVKKHQVHDKSVTTRTMLRHHLYTAHMNPDIMLHPGFKSRIMDAGRYFASNDTKMADYLLGLVVRDYGTHVITSADAGAILAQVDQVSRKFVSDMTGEKRNITAAASASFRNLVGLSAKFHDSSSKETKEQYLNQRSNSEVVTFGGPVIGANFSLSKWEDGIRNSLVAIDRAGDPLHFIVTPQNVPELPDPLVLTVAQGLEKAIMRYYKYNEIQGCTKLDSKNFNFKANFDDGTCKPSHTNFTFGGVFQTCTNGHLLDLCRGIRQKNPQTESYSCPAGYEEVLLNKGSYSTRHEFRECYRVCEWWSCRRHCANRYRTVEARYQAYWCAATSTVKANSGFLFGGLYTKFMRNPMTERFDCPEKFYPLHLFQDMKVCVSDDYELGYMSSLGFGGFFSCKAGNPLVINPHVKSQSTSLKSEPMLFAHHVYTSGPTAWPKRCPPGFSQHLASVVEDCEIEYCVRSHSLSVDGLPHIKRPPFSPEPSFSPNATTPLFIVGSGEKVWIRKGVNAWRLSSFEEVEKLGLPEKVGLTNLRPAHAMKSRGTNVSEVVGITCAVAVMVVLGVVAALVRRHYRKGRLCVELQNPYGTFNENAEQAHANELVDRENLPEENV